MTALRSDLTSPRGTSPRGMSPRGMSLRAATSPRGMSLRAATSPCAEESPGTWGDGDLLTGEEANDTAEDSSPGLADEGGDELFAEALEAEPEESRSGHTQGAGCHLADANAVAANAVAANAVGANAVGANAVGANAVAANAVGAKSGRRSCDESDEASHSYASGGPAKKVCRGSLESAGRLPCDFGGGAPDFCAHAERVVATANWHPTFGHRRRRRRFVRNLADPERFREPPPLDAVPRRSCLKSATSFAAKDAGSWFDGVFDKPRQTASGKSVTFARDPFTSR